MPARFKPSTLLSVVLLTMALCGHAALKPAVAGSSPPILTCQGDGSRIALLIGNQAYQQPIQPLSNPRRDAAAFASVLCSHGFTVQSISDAEILGFDAALDSFAVASRGARTTLVYYSGHGFAAGRRNWLVPVDARLACEDVAAENATASLKRKLVDLEDDVLNRLSGSGDLIVILDACRTDPVKGCRGSGVAGLVKGLNRSSTDHARLIVYATQDGQVALDSVGGSENSPLMTAMLNRMAKAPGADWLTAMADVSDEVLSMTGGAQKPNLDVSLRPKGCLAATCGPVVATAPLPSPSPPIRPSRAPVHECDRVGAFAWDPGHHPDVPGIRQTDIYSRQTEYKAPVAIAACRAAVAENPEEMRFAFQLAYALNALGFSAEAREAAMPAAEKRYPAAMHFVAVSFLGAGRQDEGIAWLDRAAAAGYSQAKIDRSTLIFNDDNASRSQVAEAIDLLRSAAAAGNGGAMYRLGTIYWLGSRVPPDKEAAVRWFKLGAEAGNLDSRVQLGIAYLIGQGVPRDASEGMRFIAKAASDGSPNAMAFLGQGYMLGNGIERDFGKAREWFLAAAKAENGAGHIGLASLYDKARGVERDPAEAARRIIEGSRLDPGLTPQLSEASFREQKWSRETIREVQSQLNASGRYAGPIDGRSNAALHRALVVRK